MCGIIGYTGKNDCLQILLEGLKALEYRGYDSSGVGLISPNQKILIRKRPGKIKDLIKSLEDAPLSCRATTGISHTRWATHGAPNQINAHPHTDCKDRIAVVHNGIIENYQSLKERLIKEGHKFSSQTDTEVIAHLIEKYYRKNLETAVLKVVKELKGSFAIAVICRDEPQKIVAARFFSPLIVAKGVNENFIASDAAAILRHTREVIYLEDKELVCLTPRNIRIFNYAGKVLHKKSSLIKWDSEAAQKGGFAHFMLKEIFQQPQVLSGILSVMAPKTSQVMLRELGLTQKQLAGVENITIVACGTAYHAGLVGKYIIKKLCRIPVEVDLSSEFRYSSPIIHDKTLVIAISQSGETADTLAAARQAKLQGAKVVSICNVLGSSLTRESDGVLYTHAGPEIGVASTKAYTAQIAMLCLFAIQLASLKGGLKAKRKTELLKQFSKIPQLQEKLLRQKDKINQIAQRHHHFGSFLYLGRNINFPSALEGALKLKEISYIPAEGYAAGEMKHGPIALIDEYRAVICIATDSFVYDKMLSNIQEILARRGKIIVIATEGDERIKDYVDEVIYVPRTLEIFSPLLVALPLQLLAYYIAVKRGCDVDQPRNLAKSVTVE